MTDSEITALAREYADKCIDPYGFSRGTYEEMVEEKAENVAYVLNWLSRRFCLVEKDKIRSTLRDAKLYRRSRSANCKEFEKITKVIVVLENIFPEIAKEVEE